MPTQTDGLWRHPDFRRFWTGQTLSFFGSEVTLLALPLIAVVTLDASGVQMGLLAAAGTTPALVVGLFAGAMVDRTRRRPILIAADLGRAAVLGSVPVVYLLDWLSVWYLCLVAFVAGVLTTFFDIAHASLLPSIVPREQLVEGNSKLEISRIAALAARWVAGRIGVGPAIVWGACVSDAAFLLVPVATGPVVVAVAMLTFARLIATLGGPVTSINQISLRQAITPDRLLGRVNGTMRFVSLGLAPVGALVGGFLGDLIGLRSTLIVGAVGLQIGFVILYLSPVRALKDVPATMPDPEGATT